MTRLTTRRGAVTEATLAVAEWLDERRDRLDVMDEVQWAIEDEPTASRRDVAGKVLRRVAKEVIASERWRAHLSSRLAKAALDGVDWGCLADVVLAEIDAATTPTT
jgi:hypothetical protein